MTNERGQLKGADRIRAYALAGRAILTIQNPATGNRFTYRIRAAEPKEGLRPVHFVDVLSGPDNEGDYRYIGFVTERGDFLRKSGIDANAPSALAFAWFWSHVGDPRVEVYHEGRCGKCGRTLTVPESIESGLGPVCAQMQRAS